MRSNFRPISNQNGVRAPRSHALSWQDWPIESVGMRFTYGTQTTTRIVLRAGRNQSQVRFLKFKRAQFLFRTRQNRIFAGTRAIVWSGPSYSIGEQPWGEGEGEVVVTPRPVLVVKRDGPIWRGMRRPFILFDNKAVALPDFYRVISFSFHAVYERRHHSTNVPKLYAGLYYLGNENLPWLYFSFNAGNERGHHSTNVTKLNSGLQLMISVVFKFYYLGNEHLPWLFFSFNAGNEKGHHSTNVTKLYAGLLLMISIVFKFYLSFFGFSSMRGLLVP